jgi:hypothetical protein
MKVWKWIKDKAVWIFISAAVLFFAVADRFVKKRKREEKKKDAEEKVSESKDLKEQSAYYEGVESGLREAESMLDSSLSSAEKRAEKIKKDIGGLDAEEVADRFNDLYGSDDLPN